MMHKCNFNAGPWPLKTAHAVHCQCQPASECGHWQPEAEWHRHGDGDSLSGPGCGRLRLRLRLTGSLRLRLAINMCSSTVTTMTPAVSGHHGANMHVLLYLRLPRRPTGRIFAVPVYRYCRYSYFRPVTLMSYNATALRRYKKK